MASRISRDTIPEIRPSEQCYWFSAIRHPYAKDVGAGRLGKASDSPGKA